MISERTTRIYLIFLIFIILLAFVGPILAPYEMTERMRADDGSLERTAPPSLDHPMGTTSQGYDVFSRFLIGAQPTMMAGAIGGSVIITIGLTIGLTSGYVGGRVDDVLMRFTDLVYGIPFIPFALVLIAIFGVGYLEAILLTGLILWRGSARVLRAQTLQIRERPFILAAKATGGSTAHIITRHILPNVAPMGILFMALGTGYTIIALASLAFLGVTNPFVPSWGVMVRNAYSSGLMSTAWWWSLPPGFGISLTVLSLVMFGRGFEKISNRDESESDSAIVQGG
jgi:peptide/nickel transport system permease protein